MLNKKTTLFVSACFIVASSTAFADCLGSTYAKGNDPCNTKKTTRQNYFGDYNVSGARMSREREKEVQEETRQRRIVEDQLAADIRKREAEEAEAARAQAAYEREMAMRRQEVAARNRQAAASEAAAAAARQASIDAANAAAAAKAAAKKKQAETASNPRMMHCNLNNGWCDY